jgi:indolepyruvate ferredoxin oxidoreductase alpha subunit
MGNEAFAHAALGAGVGVVAGYPGTPSSELIETVASLVGAGRATGVHVEWSTNEKAALEVCAGASLAGMRCLFTGKQVGLNVASDALLSLNYVGVKGGLVLFVADDPGPISSQTEQDTRRFASFAKVPVLDPASVEQGFAMIKDAFALSESYSTPVIVRASTRICHASTFMEVPESYRALDPAGFERSSRWVIFPRRAYEAHGEINARLRAIASDCSQGALAGFNPVEGLGRNGKDGKASENADEAAPKAGEAAQNADEAAQKADEAAPKADEAGKTAGNAGEAMAQAFANQAPRLGIVAGGVSASYVQEALELLRKHFVNAASCAPGSFPDGNEGSMIPAYRFMQVGTPYPFPEALVQDFVQGLDSVLVFEELDHVLEDELLKLCGKLHASYEVYGKLTGHTLDRGENTIDDTLQRIVAYFGMTDFLATPDPLVLAALPEPPDLPLRPPVLCAGCPHRGSFYAIKRALKALRREAVLCGDIGCYTLGNALPLDAVDTCLCMGAGITMAQGFSVAEGHAASGKKCLAFVGDSTFFASGLTGIVNAVYNGHEICLVVLDNSITAMTGAQPHPGTGETLMGQRRPGIPIEQLLRAVGFKHIVSANPFNLEEGILAAKEAIEAEGPSALVYKAPCITLVKPQEPVQVAPSCIGCKKCITEIGCPAIGFNQETRAAFVNAGQCTGCRLCVPVCPFGSIVPPTDEEGTGATMPAAAGTLKQTASTALGQDATRALEQAITEHILSGGEPHD